MGRELVSDLPPLHGGASEGEASPPSSYTDLFLDQFPFYLSIGMTYEQYWNGDCALTKYYRKAYELQRDRENEKLWLQGLYIYEALCDVSPILRAFTKKDAKPVQYSSAPYPLTRDQVARRRIEREKDAREQIKAKLDAFAIRFNAQKAAGKEVTSNG